MAKRQPRTIFLLRLLQLNLYNLLVERLRAFELSPLQYMVLTLLDSRGAWSTAELARRFQITPQSMTEVVAALDAKKLIARSKSAAHGRILNIRLTEMGRRRLAKCDAAVDRIERAAFRGYTGAELALFRDLLARALEDMAGAAEILPERKRGEATPPAAARPGLQAG